MDGGMGGWMEGRRNTDTDTGICMGMNKAQYEPQFDAPAALGADDFGAAHAKRAVGRNQRNWARHGARLQTALQVASL